MERASAMDGRLVLSFLVLLLFLVDVSRARVIPSAAKQQRICGYEGCPKGDPNKLNIHIVAHSHDDVGWLKTVDQYFNGEKNHIQLANVRAIIDTSVEELKKNPERRFIYVETAFLWKWWELQNEEKRNEVRTLINEGRLEIIGGAWSMNDEATTHYQSIVDQFTWGFRRLNDSFGQCARPKIGWQIDPFGHSREQASIFARLGFDGMFIGRLDYQDKETREKDKTLEFMWQASPSLGKQADLFSVVLYNGYSPPPGYCFDNLCADAVIIDDPTDKRNNVQKRVKGFYEYSMKQAKYYQTNNIILTMGGDFTYQRAEKYFTNLDKMIKYLNQIYGEEVNAFYSTPSCYLKSVHEARKTWTAKTDDFFPYADNSHSYWTGYFTSRPTLKYFERLGNNFLQVVKQLSVLSRIMDTEDLQLFREVMGVMQHHDAVTGTEKQHVADDYAKLLHEVVVKGEKITSSAMSELSKSPGERKEPTERLREFRSCLLLNISSCQPTENSKSFGVSLYNARSHRVSTYVRIPVKGKAYIVKDQLGNELSTQLLPIPLPVRHIAGRHSNATRELVFHAVDIPPLGHQSYYIDEKGANSTDELTKADETATSIGGDLYDISVDDSGKVTIEWKTKNMKVSQGFNYYKGEKRFRPSGAYVFRPLESVMHNLEFTGSHVVYRGPLVEELHIIINKFVSQTVRVYKGEKRIEFDWVVGPIPIEDHIAREVVTRYSSNLASDGVFYTDSNGREMIKRVRYFRPTWNVDLAEPIAGNYYPITTKISLQDTKKKLRMSVLTDRAQGGTSMRDGELEVMLHRRLLVDDSLGVGEPLNEVAFGQGLIARGVHYLIDSDLQDLENTVLHEKSLAQSLALKPWLLVTPVQHSTFEQWQNQNLLQSSGLKDQLPLNVQIMSLEPWKDNQVLMRLEHFFEVGEARNLSTPVKINLKNLLADFDVTRVRETTLGGNQWIEDVERLQWDYTPGRNRAGADISALLPNVEHNDDDNIVLLNPMEIRTFIMTIKPIPKS